MPDRLKRNHAALVILRNEPIFASSDPDWVRTVQGLPLDPRQKRALIRFAEGEFSNGDYQKMNSVDRDQSYRELQQLVELGLLAPEGQGKGTRYHVVRSGAAQAAAATPLDVLKLRMHETGFITNANYREAFRVNRDAARAGLQAWVQEGRLVMSGERKGARYTPGPKWTS